MPVIAEALNERKTLYATAKAAATQVAVEAVVEKKNPDSTAETVQELLHKMNAALSGARELTIALNQANNTQTLQFDGITMTVMEAIALRDQMTLQHSLKSEILSSIDTALGKRGRHSLYYGRKTKDEVKEVSLIDREQFRKDLDNLAEQRRLLDIEIQKVNWSAEL